MYLRRLHRVLNAGIDRASSATVRSGSNLMAPFCGAQMPTAGSIPAAGGSRQPVHEDATEEVAGASSPCEIRSRAA